ncbi:MAG TPA: PRC-barrel domain-containing protein [Methylomirabilota bacterium]|jgi:sporulation protein YlmC with PRC-barrel domain|nr:PRC-barrel domain-containing protein [Methylomirabilota bacterium]
MKKLLVTLILPAFVLAPLAASAQTPTTPKSPAPDSKAPAAAKDTPPAWKNDANLLESRNVVGMRIKNEQGKDMGEVDNLLIDPQSGKISHVIVGLGGFMGVGERKVVVAWSELKVAPAADGKKPTATMEQAKLETAPRWERTAAADRNRTSSTPSASPKSYDKTK